MLKYIMIPLQSLFCINSKYTKYYIQYASFYNTKSYFLYLQQLAI